MLAAGAIEFIVRKRKIKNVLKKEALKGREKVIRKIKIKNCETSFYLDFVDDLENYFVYSTERIEFYLLCSSIGDKIGWTKPPTQGLNLEFLLCRKYKDN